MSEESEIFLNTFMETLDQAIESGVIFEHQGGRLRALYLRIVKEKIKKQFDIWKK